MYVYIYIYMYMEYYLTYGISVDGTIYWPVLEDILGLLAGGRGGGGGGEVEGVLWLSCSWRACAFVARRRGLPFRPSRPRTSTKVPSRGRSWGV